VDGAAIPIPAAAHSRTGVDTDTYGKEVAACADLVQRALRQYDGVGRIVRPDHHAVAHRLDLPGIEEAAQRAHRAAKLARQVSRGLISQSFGGGGEADEIHEHERRETAPLAAPESGAQQLNLRSCINIRERIKLHIRMERKRLTQAEKREQTRE